MKADRRAEHGGISGPERVRLERELGMEVVDLSVNLNPMGPPAAVLEAFRSCSLEVYPDPSALELGRAYGERYGSGAEQFVFGNGATELLWSLARHHAPAPVIMVEPTFGEYARGAQVAGSRIVELWAGPSGNELDPERLVSEARRVEAGSVYLCRPNNPTGHSLPFGEVHELAEELGPTVLVLDESFLSLSDHSCDANRPLPANVVRVRSLTKDFAIPGLRLGYLVARQNLAQRLEQERPPWTTSAPAQAAGFAILDEEEGIVEVRSRLLAGRGELRAGLSAFGLHPLPTTTLFTLVEVGDGRRFRTRLLRSGVVVRDTASFQLPRHVRIAAGSASDRERLWAALGKQVATP